jgi:hypothetical protein
MAVLLVACEGSHSIDDLDADRDAAALEMGPIDFGRVDGGAMDLGGPDLSAPDFGPPDAGDDAAALDEGIGDLGAADDGVLDAELPDFGAPDAGLHDLGTFDLGAPDLGAPDLGAPDLGPPDLGAPDLGAPDLGAPDLGAPDLGPPDLGAPDLGAPDAGGAPGWRLSSVESAATVGPVVSVALDSGGNAHVLYADQGVMRLRHAWQSGGTWFVEDVGTDNPTPTSVSLTVYNDIVYVSYQRSDTHELCFARRISGAWVFETIDDVGDCGALTDIAVGISEHAQIICQEAAGLRYVYWTGAAWMHEVWDASPNLIWISLSIDPWEHSHLSYYDAVNGDLKYGYRIGDVVVTGPIDTAGDVGAYSSLVMDANAEPHISYQDTTNGDLKLAHWNGSGWIFTVVDTSVGQGTSIAIDSMLHPRISYFDSTMHDLKYASWDGLSWTVEVVDTEVAAGAHSSLALDALERPRISYPASTGEIRHAAFW